MGKHISWAVMLVLVLTACNQKKDAGAVQPKELPLFTIDQMIEFGKNERAELAQRCLGVQDKTCTDFKSETFKNRDGLAKTFCDMEEAQRLAKGAAKASPRRAKCNVYY